MPRLPNVAVDECGLVGSPYQSRPAKGEDQEYAVVELGL
jgi:hypothetical protein